MYCTQCGTQNLEEANYCEQCGNRFEKQAKKTVDSSTSNISAEEDEETSSAKGEKSKYLDIRSELLTIYGIAVLIGMVAMPSSAQTIIGKLVSIFGFFLGNGVLNYVIYRSVYALFKQIEHCLSASLILAISISFLGAIALGTLNSSIIIGNLAFFFLVLVFHRKHNSVFSLNSYRESGEIKDIGETDRPGSLEFTPQGTRLIKAILAVAIIVVLILFLVIRYVLPKII